MNEGKGKGAITRRKFLEGLLKSFGWFGVSFVISQSVPLADNRTHWLQHFRNNLSRNSRDRFTPEYLSSLEEVLFVFDQVEPPYFFNEVINVINNLPPRTKVYFLASQSRAETAREILNSLDIRMCEVISVPVEKLWGDWGRDIFQIGWRGGRRVALVPFNKQAKTRGQLTRGYEVLENLARPELNVALAPLSFEGGNLLYDILDNEKVLMVGNSAILDTIAIYRYWFAKKISVKETIDLFKKTFEVDRVVTMGREKDGNILPQSDYTFHIDMSVTIPAREVAVVASFDPDRIDTKEIEYEFEKELKELIENKSKRDEAQKLLHKKGIKISLPENKNELKEYLSNSLQREITNIKEASKEMESMAGKLKELGYRIKRIQTDWRHVRKYQSYTNVITSRDRIIMPIFPSEENIKVRSIPTPDGKIMAGIVAGEKPNEYRLEGLNLSAYNFYYEINNGTRVVEDCFYLTCGNVHCIMGRIS